MQEERISGFDRQAFPNDHNNSALKSFSEPDVNSVNTSGTSDLDAHSMRLLYFYGTLPLIFFCIISVAVNIKVLVCVYWIRRPLSPTLHISLSLAGADAFSSSALGVGLVVNSFIPEGLGLKFPGMILRICRKIPIWSEIMIRNFFKVPDASFWAWRSSELAL